MWRRAVGRSPGSVWATSRAAGVVAPGEMVNLHQVRIKPRKNLARKATTYALTFAACYVVWGTVAFLPLKRLDPVVVESQQEEDELEPLFLPFPFTEKQIQPLPYAGAEEEWQSFVKFNADEKLRKRVKDDLNLIVKKAAESNPYTKKWGKTGEGFQLGPSWLIMSFPERPPPEFIRWGLEWNDEGLFLKTQKLDARTKALLDRVFKPYPVASASYEFGKAMVKQNASKVAQYFGYYPRGKEINTSSPDPDIEKTIKKLEARQTAYGGTPSGASSSTVASSTSAAESTLGSRNSEASGTSDAQNSNRDLDKSTASESIPFYSTLVEKGSGPWAAFQQEYKRNWKPLRYYPPRGSVAVHGMVSLDSPKARVFIDVFAWYQPKEDKFHEDSLTMSLRAVTPLGQKPRR